MSRKLALLDNLIYVKRYSGNLLIKEESVADHTWCMISLAIEYLPQLNKRTDNYFNIEEVITGIALHDLEESLTGDIMRPFKYHNKTILEAVKKTSDSLLHNYIGDDWYNYIKKLTDKGVTKKLIKILDLAQAGYKMISEIKLGNEYFKSELGNILDCLDGQYDDIDELTNNKDVIGALRWIINEFYSEFKSYQNKYCIEL